MSSQTTVLHAAQALDPSGLRWFVIDLRGKVADELLRWLERAGERVAKQAVVADEDSGGYAGRLIRGPTERMLSLRGAGPFWKRHYATEQCTHSYPWD